GPALESPARLHVQDNRDKKDLIGANVERSTPRDIRTDDKPADFVRDVLIERLRAAGVEVADVGSAKRTINVKLNRFWCVENDRYRAEVAVSVQVYQADGQMIWEGVVSGADST